jgi:hypothetical protein
LGNDSFILGAPAVVGVEVLQIQRGSDADFPCICQSLLKLLQPEGQTNYMASKDALSSKRTPLTLKHEMKYVPLGQLASSRING